MNDHDPLAYFIARTGELVAVTRADVAAGLDDSPMMLAVRIRRHAKRHKLALRLASDVVSADVRTAYLRLLIPVRFGR
jgi:hypothetical protein